MDEKKTNGVEDKAVQNEFGSVKVSEEVVTNIAARAASEIEGIAGMSGGITQGIAERLGRKDSSKGLKVKVKENEAQIELYIIVNYGIAIPEIASNMQNKVKDVVEKMTGLKVTEVNINVQGINFPEEKEES